METKAIGFIGGGRITKIFLEAFSNKKFNLSLVSVYDINPEELNLLKKQFPQIQVSDSIKFVAEQETVVIALHPPSIMEALEQIKESITEDTQVISLAPKVSIEKMSTKLAINNIVRVIPNATSYINEGFNPVSFATAFSATEKQSLLEMLNLLGNTFEVQEDKLEAYAIISAMLPTYFWFQWEEMQKIGKQMGLDEEESKIAVKETLLSAISLFYDSNLSSNEVIDLIPVKPIGEHEAQITDIYKTKLMGLFEKIKP